VCSVVCGRLTDSRESRWWWTKSGGMSNNLLGVPKTLLGVSDSRLGVSNTRLGVSYFLLGVSNTLLDASNTLLGVSNTLLGVPNTLLALSCQLTDSRESEWWWTKSGDRVTSRLLATCSNQSTRKERLKKRPVRFPLWTFTSNRHVQG